MWTERSQKDSHFMRGLGALRAVSMRAVHCRLRDDPPSPVHYGNQCQDGPLLPVPSLPRTADPTAV